VIEAMQRGERPVFKQADEEAVYDFTTELCVNHKISDATYQRALKMYDVPKARRAVSADRLLLAGRVHDTRARDAVAR
jgi:hypothetical protein